jgi:hypothetical protein
VAETCKNESASNDAELGMNDFYIAFFVDIYITVFELRYRKVLGAHVNYTEYNESHSWTADHVIPCLKISRKACVSYILRRSVSGLHLTVKWRKIPTIEF